MGALERVPDPSDARAKAHPQRDRNAPDRDQKHDNPGKDDLIFRDDDENTFQTGDVIRVTGKISVAKGSGETTSCHMMRPKSIQKL